MLHWSSPDLEGKCFWMDVNTRFDRLGHKKLACKDAKIFQITHLRDNVILPSGLVILLP